MILGTYVFYVAYYACCIDCKFLIKYKKTKKRNFFILVTNAHLVVGNLIK